MNIQPKTNQSKATMKEQQVSKITMEQRRLKKIKQRKKKKETEAKILEKREKKKKKEQIKTEIQKHVGNHGQVKAIFVFVKIMIYQRLIK